MKTDQLELRRSRAWIACLALFFIVPYFAARICQSIAGYYYLLIWLCFAVYLYKMFSEQQALNKMTAITGLICLDTAEYLKLTGIIEKQCKKVNTNDLPDLFVFDDGGATAMLVGLGILSSPKICIAWSKLRELDGNIIEAIIAHEISHHLNKDIVITFSLKALMGILSLSIFIIGTKPLY